MKVGVFDSGLGGLTVLKSILKVFRNAEIFYIADTEYAPYGEKSSQEILDRCDKITAYLLENYGIEALIVACNTATSAAIKHLREKFPFLIVEEMVFALLRLSSSSSISFTAILSKSSELAPV